MNKTNRYAALGAMTIAVLAVASCTQGISQDDLDDAVAEAVAVATETTIPATTATTTSTTSVSNAWASIPVLEANCIGVFYGMAVASDHESSRRFGMLTMEGCLEGKPLERTSFEAHCIGIYAGYLIWNGDEDASADVLKECIESVGSDEDYVAVLSTGVALLMDDVELFVDAFTPAQP